METSQDTTLTTDQNTTPPADPNVIDVQATEVDNQEAGNDDQTGNVQPSGGKKPIQPRINELTRARHEAEREAAYWRGVAETRAAKETPPAEKAAETPAKPVVGDFQTYEEFVDALTDWKADRAVEKALSAVDTKLQKKEAAQTADIQQNKVAEDWKSRQDAIRKVVADYDDVVANSNVMIRDHVGSILLESDYGPEIAYKMAKDPALADKLNALDPIKAAKEIGKLESAIEAAAPAPESAPATQQERPTANVVMTKAPAPPNPVNGGRSTAKSLDKMSMDEYIVARRTQGAGWAKHIS